ncbi:hypothetical protein [Nocardia sp. NPDC005998]|uniref:hypothetical protein n=1 Tax=Nocardia sp. NPDC005998 TaxID=3156894 RepID=UPI0033ACCFAB
MADQGWREQPKTRSHQVFDDACRMIGEHARRFAHRYRERDGLRNPSVYCADLKKLIYHIESRVRADIDSAINT